MIHGNTQAEFRKLFSETATPLFNEVLLRLAASMGPADEPNPSIPAGWTYLGQFVDHDLTFDTENGINSRTPVFDLDSLYGKGPNSPEHHDLFEGTPASETFRIGNAGNETGDLARNESFVAKIPDPRNDENIIIASLHLLFQKFHNALVVGHGLDFATAKQTVCWHYQSIVRFDFLPRIVGAKTLDDIRINGRRVFTVSELANVFMPLEYSGACYRFGHSMVRERYSFNDTFTDTRSNPNLFFSFPGGRPVSGGHQITKVWTHQGPDDRGVPQSLLRFFDPSILNPLTDADNLSGKIDTKLASVLFNLEVSPGQNNILAHRNLVAGQRLQLPNGQQVVAELNRLGFSISPLTEVQILSSGAPIEIATNTPLWYYILKEAELQNNGAHLGQVGGTIVAETIIGLLESDPESFVNRTTDWPFKLGQPDSDLVTIIDLIKFIDGL